VADRSDRFFTWVWRVNGLVLLALGVVGLAGTIALIFNVGLFWSRDRPEQQLTQVAGADLGAKDLRLADFRPIAGTQFLYAALAPPSEYIGSGSSGGFGLAHNLLFFDMNSKKTHWLLPDNDQVIQSFSFFMDPPAASYTFDGEARKRDQVAIAILLELQRPRETTDATGESRSLAIASAEGRALTSIAQSIGGLLGYHQSSTESAFVFYVSDGAARVLDVNPTTRKVRSDGLLSAQQ
jgi:hypothetical protein